MLVRGKDFGTGTAKQDAQSKGDNAVDRGFKIGKYELYAFLIIVFALLLRIVLTVSGWPQTNSDEDTMGLMAMHIASHGEHPIFFYGQTYMGALEAYLGAAIFQVFGASVFALRLVTILLFTLFLVSMYLLTSLLYSKKLALVTLVLLGLGSNVVLDVELIALGGYPELLLFGSLALLLSTWLALSADQHLSRGRQFLRMVVYACWGLLVGIGLWSDFLMFIFVVVSGLLLLVFCWRELLKGAVLPLLLGLLIGASPLIAYNLKPLPGQDTLKVLSLLHNYGSVELAHSVYSKDPLLQEVSETLLITLPSATGGPSLCNDRNLRVSGYASIGPFQCPTLLQAQHGQIFLALAWSLGFILLWAIGVFLAIQGIFRLLRGSSRPWSAEQRRSAVRYAGHLMLLGSAGLSLALFVESPGAAVWPNNARYLIDLLIATPALIAPLWGLAGDYTTQGLGIKTGKGPRARFLAVSLLANPPRITAILGRGILLLIGVVLLVGTITTFSEIPSVQTASKQEEMLISDLIQMKVTHIYSDYWTCNRIIFLSKEQILCGVIPPGRNRYPLYYVTVKNDPNSAYVLSGYFSQGAAVAEQIGRSQKRYRRFVLDGYVIYEPSS